MKELSISAARCHQIFRTGRNIAQVVITLGITGCLKSTSVCHFQ